MDVKKTDWMESVRLVFDYFCERTPRSFVESREASIVWNYKCALLAAGRRPNKRRRRVACATVVAGVEPARGAAPTSTLPAASLTAAAA